MTRIGIGIDTGGTYTDAVAYDFGRGTVLAASKALTTKHDLSIGILEALDKIPAELTGAAALVSLSTTLATNACVENRMGRAKLVFFGGDPDIVDRFGGEYGLPRSGEIHFQDGGTNWSDGVIGEVDWDGFAAAMRECLPGLDGIGVIEIYSMRNGAVVEKRAKEVLRELTRIPVVCAHELVNELNSLQRGASTLLNASLFPIIDSFILAIKSALEKRGVAAPVVIVRSDGNLMSEAFASLRPAETLLCGPAASVMGAMELTGLDDCVVVDIGGTTTDIAVVREGEPLKAENGIGVGRWKTFIKGVYIKTVGLGGDSAVHYNSDREVVLEEYRVVPLSIACRDHPGLLAQLAEEVELYPSHTRFVHEAFIRVRDIADASRYDETEKRLCAALEDGPLLRRRAARAAGRDEYNLDVSRLVREGIVQVAGFTPTDAMHIRGEFDGHDAEASRLAARFVAGNLDTTVDRLCEMVYDAVKSRLYVNVVLALLEQEDPRLRKRGADPAVVAMIRDNYRKAARGGRAGFLDVGFKTELPLVGIGAPTHLFLGDVARLLGTTAVVPEHASVANALGAIVGRIHARCEIDIRADYNTEGITGYTVFGVDGTRTFAERVDAEAFALSDAEAGARAEAVRRGATGAIAVSAGLAGSSGTTKGGSIDLGGRAVAHAVGSASF